MLEATGAFDEALELVVDAAGLLTVELLTCEALELVTDEALAGVLELTADDVLLEVALEATDDFTDEAELDVLPALADDLADDFTADEAVLAGASCFADVALAPECPKVTLAALRACSAVRAG